MDDMEDSSEGEAPPRVEIGFMKSRELVKHSLSYGGGFKNEISSCPQVDSDDEGQKPRKRGRPPKTSQRMDVAVGKGLLITSRGKPKNSPLVISDKGKPEGNISANPLMGASAKYDDDLMQNSRRHIGPPSKKQKHDALAEPIFKGGISLNRYQEEAGLRSLGRSSAPLSEDESEQESDEEQWRRKSKAQEYPPVKKQKRDLLGLSGNKDPSKQSRPNVGMLALAGYEKDKSQISQPRQHATVNSRSFLQDAVDSSSDLGDFKYSCSSEEKKDKDMRKSSHSGKEMNGNGARVYSDVSNTHLREFQKEKTSASSPPDEFLFVQGSKKSEGLSDTSEKTHGRGRKKVASVDLPPDELRCIRSDGRSWRCTAYAIPGGRRCQKHLSQLVAAQKRQQINKGSPYVKSTNGKVKLQPADFGITTEELNMSEFPSSNSHEKAVKKLLPNSSTHIQKSPNVSTLSTKVETLPGSSKALNEKGSSVSDRSSPNHTVKGKTKSSPDGDMLKLEQGNLCHQCQRNDKGAIVTCQKCNRRRYCLCCLTRWYPHLSEQDMRKACPFCRGQCTCKSCLHLKQHSKEEVHMHNAERLKCLQYMLGIILPFLKQLNEVQRLELELETNMQGAPMTKLPRAPIGKDDCILCDNCGTSIVDFHRSCPDCDYDLCLTCCQELRQGKQPESENPGLSLESSGQQPRGGLVARSANKVSVSEFPVSYEHDAPLGKTALPESIPSCLSEKVEEDITPGANQSALWKANDDGTIPCAPPERGCGSPLLVLKTLHRANYLENLVTEVENFVDTDVDVWKSEGEACPICVSESTVSSSLRLAAQRSDSDGNFIYAPLCQEAKEKGLDHFRRHWVHGEPVIVKDVLSAVSALCWEPMALWRATQEVARHYVHNDSKFVTAVDCYDSREVDVSIYEFLSGYEVGYMDRDGWPKMMKLDWPTSIVFEERLPRHCSEFLACIPFYEYTHPKRGVMNLAAKFPGAAKPDLGPKSYIAYGVREELGIGDSLTNLQCGASDLVCVLMHASEPKLSPWQWKQAHRARERLEAGSRNFKSCGTYDDEGLDSRRSKRSTKLGLTDVHINPNSHGHGHAEDGELHVALEFSDEENKRKSAFGSQTSLVKNPLFGTGKQKQEIESALKSKSLSSGSHEGTEEEESDSSDEESHHNESAFASESDDSSVAASGVTKVSHGSAVWDVFRRQDVPKLQQYLKKYSNDLARHGSMERVHPIHDQLFFLNSQHKRKLKEEFQVETWTFEQNLGEAVFIPAGCPYQIRNLKSCVKVALEFVSPESLQESLRVTEEYRLLPRNHHAHEDTLQVKKMIVHAASQALMEIKRLKTDNR